MSTDVTIREAVPSEWGAIGELTYAAYEPLFEGAPMGRYGKDLRDVEGRAKHASIVVAELDASLVGAVAYLDDYGADPTMAKLGCPREPGFRLLAVHPDAQGRDIGGALIRHCVDRARAAGSAGLLLHTTSFMAKAESIYQAMGFERLPAVDMEVPSKPKPVEVRAYRLNL